MCMAVFGGAAVPPLMGLLGDLTSVRWSFLVPLAAFVYLGALALAWARETAPAAA
jgi:FHS family L-fucose permease-like MFS transporter